MPDVILLQNHSKDYAAILGQDNSRVPTVLELKEQRNPERTQVRFPFNSKDYAAILGQHHQHLKS